MVVRCRERERERQTDRQRYQTNGKNDDGECMIIDL